MDIKTTFDDWTEMIIKTPTLFIQIARSQGWNEEKIVFFLSVNMDEVKTKLDEVITNANTV